MHVQFTNLVPSRSLNNEIMAACQRVVSSGRYILGTEVETFEQRWADYCGVKHCVSCGNGFDAIQLILRGYGLNCEVGVSSYTCAPSWVAVKAAGCYPVTVDDNRSNVILGVHLYGLPTIIYNARLWLEDCAQAHGMEYNGKRAGALGDAAAWSFYPTKNLGAVGDAGAVTTNDESLARELRHLRAFNRARGITSRMDALQAAILCVKLKYLDEWNDTRRRNAAYYLANVTGVELPVVIPGANPCWYQFVIRHKRRDELKTYLENCGVETMIHYPQPPYRLFNVYDTEVEDWANEVLSLPIAPHVTIKQVEYVTACVNEWGNS
jgi:dTDP-4-amino-4,6-dideoxygalactose transaminase